MPGCVTERDFCRKVEQPLFQFFMGPLRTLMRYSHKDHLDWDGSDCEKLRAEIRSVIRKREAGYPFMAESETLWFVLPRNGDRIDWSSEKCDLKLGEIISGETQRPIPTTADHRSDVASGARNLTYHSTSVYTLPMSNPNVVVEIRVPDKV